MREIQKPITVRKVIDHTTVATSESIVSIYENKQESSVEVIVAYHEESGDIIKKDSFLISDGNYELLMSESPSFAPGKPANEYREADLWHIVDLIRAEDTA